MLSSVLLIVIYIFILLPLANALDNHVAIRAMKRRWRKFRLETYGTDRE
jgi:hypothetical protein